MISLRRIVKNSLKWNVFSIFCLFLLITVPGQLKSQAPTAKYNVSSSACAGFTQAYASVDVSISNVGYFRGTLGRYGGSATGQAGNKEPVTEDIGVEIYRPTSRGLTLGLTVGGVGGTVGGTVSGGYLSTRETKNFSTSDWRLPTSRNTAWCNGTVWDWNGEVSVPSRRASYNGSINLTTSGNGNMWIAATCDPSSY